LFVDLSGKDNNFFVLTSVFRVFFWDFFVFFKVKKVVLGRLIYELVADSCRKGRVGSVRGLLGVMWYKKKGGSEAASP